ncbi:cell division protein FtsP [Tatumella sp. UCD-D_suzukii]|uniref:cell division protein FtsP n=1 Tax=Tatumella sp. UCD-D_suzukii TaxID=1408192 RepID=UPI00046F01CB|nr:cell division protein FtsP [Tatumella sp. UCD-D_suzukii]
MSFSRRQFLQLSAAAVAGTTLLPQVAQAEERGENPLPVPPLLESRRGQPLFLTLQSSHWAFSGGNKAPVWGFNGRYLGPTVRVKNGDDVKLIYSNRLQEAVSMTISGLQVPGALNGGAPRQISPNVDWAPVLPVRQPAATCWYHADTPHLMAPHVYNGLAGMWLIEDDNSKSLALPKHYGLDDFPLIIQDKRLDNFGSPEYDSHAKEGFYGDVLLVNGVQKPYVNVSRGWVRLRLLNASNARRYQLQLSDNRPFTVIAGDQGFLPAPVMVQQLALAPGERREVLVDLSQGNDVSITAGTAATFVERIKGIFQPSSILTSTLVLTLRPTGLLPLVTNDLPTQLNGPAQQSSVTGSRQIRLDDSPPGINGSAWDMMRIDTVVTQGTTERWTVQANHPQPFHIQGAVFLISSINGAPPMAEDRGWKDTVWVDGTVELLVTFPHSSSEHFPFVYYSQNLELADRGVAGQLMVQQAIN